MNEGGDEQAVVFPDVQPKVKVKLKKVILCSVGFLVVKRDAATQGILLVRNARAGAQLSGASIIMWLSA